MTAGVRPDPTRLARAVLLALAAAFVLSLAAGRGSGSPMGRLGGDFPEFYAAGRIVLEGDGDQLYDIDRHESEQAGLYGDQGGFLDYAYPPVVALAAAPLAALPYRAAYAVATLMMVGALIGALWAVRPMVPVLEGRFTVAVAGALAAFPLLMGVGNGQNTAISVLALALAWRAWHEGRDVDMGLAAGLLFFKPQYVVLVVVALAAIGAGRALFGVLVTGALSWAAGVVVVGPSWVPRFLDHARDLSAIDAHEGARNVSLTGLSRHVLGSSTPGTVVSLLVLGAVASAARRQARDAALVLGLVAAGTVLAIPHVIVYDAGLLVIAALALLARGALAPGEAVALTVVSWVGAWTALPVNALTLVAGFLFLRLLRCAFRSGPTPNGRGRRRSSWPVTPTRAAGTAST